MTEWPNHLFDALRANDVTQVAYVPDAGHQALIDACIAEKSMADIPLTTEEEGITLLAGAWLGGRRGVLLMQSSGVGNCINMLSLTRTCRFPLAMFVTMRGQWHEFNPWQNPMGETAAQALETAGVSAVDVSDPAEVGPQAGAALHRAFVGGGAVAVLLNQRLMPVKTFSESGSGSGNGGSGE